MEQDNAIIRIVIVEDNALFRDLLRRELAGQKTLEVVGSVSDGESAIQVSRELSPDVVIMDIILAGRLSGIEAARQIKAERPQTGILVLSSHKDKEYLASVPFREATGWSYLLKQSVADVDTLVRAVEGSARGLMVVDPEVVAGLLPVEGSQLAGLGPRHLEVLGLMAQGYNNAAIGTRMSLTTKSVENYISVIFHELLLSDEDEIHARVKATLIYLDEGRTSQSSATGA